MEFPLSPAELQVSTLRWAALRLSDHDCPLFWKDADAAGDAGEWLLRLAKQIETTGTTEGTPPEVCPSCWSVIDREVCGCGVTLADHSPFTGHPFIPMGCDCYRESEASTNSSPPKSQEGHFFRVERRKR